MPKPRTSSSKSKSQKLKAADGMVTKRALAAACGVTERTIDRWRHKLGFPDSAGGLFSLADVSEWIEIFGTKSSENSTEAADVQLCLKQEMLAVKQLERKRLQRADEIAEGQMLPKVAYEAFLSQLMTTARDQFYRAPKRLAAFVPNEARMSFIAEAERIVVRILDDMAATIERGPDPETLNDVA